MTGDGWKNDRQALAMMFMLDLAPLSTTTYAELTSCSPSAALIDLAELVKTGLAERVGKGRNTRYRVHPDLLAAIQKVDAEFRAEEQELRSSDKAVG